MRLVYINSNSWMLYSFPVALFVFAASIATPCWAQSQQKAAEPDPVDSFKLTLGKFQTFFASGPRKAVMKRESGYHKGGEFVVDEVTARNLSYDVQKTDSLVSPFKGTLLMEIISRENSGCGDLKHDGEGFGFSTVQGALAALDGTECYRYSPLPKQPTVYAIALVFAFQDGTWVFKSAMQVDYGNAWLLGQSLLGDAAYPATRFPEPEAEALNAPWRALVH
jgi:hypothetical protein